MSVELAMMSCVIAAPRKSRDVLQKTVRISDFAHELPDEMTHEGGEVLRQDRSIAMLDANVSRVCRGWMFIVSVFLDFSCMSWCRLVMLSRRNVHHAPRGRTLVSAKLRGGE